MSWLPVLVVAAAHGGCIGRQNTLPWSVPEDLRRFRALTKGGAVIMGRKTWESLPRRPLPDRLNVVVSRHLLPLDDRDTSIWVRTPDEARAFCAASGRPTFVIGGAQMYRLFVAASDCIELTEVDAPISAGDAFFDVPDTHSPSSGWMSEDGEWAMSTSGVRYRFRTIRRISRLSRTQVITP